MLHQFEFEAEAGAVQAEVVAIHLDDRCPANAPPDQLLNASDGVASDVHDQSFVCRLDTYIVDWLIGNMRDVMAIRALASERRLQILAWLRDPVAHFPPQTDGDLKKDGVCGLFIAEKLGVSQPTASEHMRILSQAGLVRAKRIKKWTFYKRDEANIREFKRSMLKSI